MLRHRPRLLLLIALPLTALTFGTARAQGPVVEVLGPDGPPSGAQGTVRTPERYDARGRRLPPTPPRGQQPPAVQPRPIVIDPPPPPVVLVVPGQDPQLAAPPPVDLGRRERRRGNVYAAFGFQSGLAMGIGAGLALTHRGQQERVGRVVGGLGAPLLAATLAVLLKRWARNDHWREGPGQALTGIYPGAIQGGLFAASIIHAFDFEGEQVPRTLGVAIGATTLLSMVLHRTAGERAAKRAGLYYVTLLAASLLTAPIAYWGDRPEAMLYGATAAGAVHLALTGLSPVIRW